MGLNIFSIRSGDSLIDYAGHNKRYGELKTSFEQLEHRAQYALKSVITEITDKRSHLLPEHVHMTGGFSVDLIDIESRKLAVLI